jgi:hypothetical protein
VKATSGTAALTLATAGGVTVDGTGVTINPATSFAGTVSITGAATFVGRPVLSMTGFMPGIYIASIIAVAGNVAPTQNAPDGTLYVTY